MQFVKERDHYVFKRPNVVFGTGNKEPSGVPRAPIVEEDRREGLAYDRLKKNIKECVRFDGRVGFRFKTLLLVGTPMCGKSSLLLKMCSQNPHIQVYSVKIADFVSKDIPLLFSNAKDCSGAIIIIEDLDNVLNCNGESFYLQRKLMAQIRKMYKTYKYRRGKLMVIGESSYPWNLQSEVIDKYFPNRLCMQEPTRQTMLAQQEGRFEFPQKWIDTLYLRELQAYKIEHVKPINFFFNENPTPKLSWLLDLFSRMRDGIMLRR